jgi:hypothetical protein
MTTSSISSPRKSGNPNPGANSYSTSSTTGSKSSTAVAGSKSSTSTNSLAVARGNRKSAQPNPASGKTDDENSSKMSNYTIAMKNTIVADNVDAYTAIRKKLLHQVKAMQESVIREVKVEGGKGGRGSLKGGRSGGGGNADSAGNAGNLNASGANTGDSANANSANNASGNGNNANGNAGPGVGVNTAIGATGDASTNPSGTESEEPQDILAMMNAKANMKKRVPRWFARLRGLFMKKSLALENSSGGGLGGGNSGSNAGGGGLGSGLGGSSGPNNLGKGGQKKFGGINNLGKGVGKKGAGKGTGKGRRPSGGVEFSPRTGGMQRNFSASKLLLTTTEDRTAFEEAIVGVCFEFIVYFLRKYRPEYDSKL